MAIEGIIRNFPLLNRIYQYFLGLNRKLNEIK